MRKISKQDLINDVKKVFENGNTTREYYLLNGKYSMAPIRRLFGGWNNLLQELNQDINMNKNVTKEEVLSEMNLLYNKFGKLTSNIQRKYSKYSQSVIDNLFGSFTNLLSEMNLPINGKFISDEDIKNNIISIYNEYGFISKDLIENYCIVSHPTLLNRFGSLQSLCDELNIPLYTNAKSSKLSMYVLGVISGIIKEEPKFEYTFDWLINPKTNQNLRLDAYYPSLNLAIEINGRQHYDRKSFFHKTEKDFKEAIFRDKLKKKLLKEHNIHLIEISYKDSFEQIENKIKSFLSNS